MTRLSLGTPRTQPVMAAPAFWEVELPEGTPWTQSYRMSGGYLVRFPGLADFEIALDLGRIECHPAPDVGDETCRHLYRNQVLPMVLSHGGHLVCHASCVAVGGGAIAFVGRSGLGKSTLAASFAAHGDRVMADDGLVVESHEAGYRAIPADPSIRLWEDSGSALLEPGTLTAPSLEYTSKLRLLAGPALAFCSDALPLRAVYFLGNGTAAVPAITPMTSAETLMGLAGNTFLLDPDDHAVLGAHFHRLASLADGRLCHGLDYPRNYEVLPCVRETILRHLAEEET